VNRRTLTNYAFLPNYRNYWKEAGYREEMDAVEAAIAEGRKDDVPKFFSDKWLADNTLFGPGARVREGVEAWRDTGVQPDHRAILRRRQPDQGAARGFRSVRLSERPANLVHSAGRAEAMNYEAIPDRSARQPCGLGSGGTRSWIDLS
jgi:hypothetical protein